MAVRDLLLLICREVDANDVRRWFVVWRGVTLVSSSPSSWESSSVIRLSDRVAGLRGSLGPLARFEDVEPGEATDLVPAIAVSLLEFSKMCYTL
jgi:hypothetical protein